MLATREEVESGLKNIVARYKQGEIDLQASYKQLGLEETDALEIIAVLGMELDAEVDPNKAMLVTSLPETIDLVLDSLNNPAAKPENSYD